MELYKIEILLEKYFEGETTLAEEKALKDYFSSSDVASHLEQYSSLFGYYGVAKAQQYEKAVPVLEKQQRHNSSKMSNRSWLSVAASILVLIGVVGYVFFTTQDLKEDKKLGTFDDPEVAFKATQKALALLSNKVNVGIESVQYVEEYQIAKNKVFRKTKNKNSGI